MIRKYFFVTYHLYFDKMDNMAALSHTEIHRIPFPLVIYYQSKTNLTPCLCFLLRHFVLLKRIAWKHFNTITPTVILLTQHSVLSQWMLAKMKKRKLKENDGQCGGEQIANEEHELLYAHLSRVFAIRRRKKKACFAS